jgi:primosomal protein N'
MSSGDSAANKEPGSATALVVPLVPAWRIDAPFDYLVPDHLSEKAVPGALVRVPFGGRRVRGLVVAVDNSGQPSERVLEEILAVSFAVPIAPPPHLDLVDWIAERYVAPRGRAYRLAVPPRVRVTSWTKTSVPPGPRPQCLLEYSRGPELLDAIESNQGAIWCLQPVPGEDHGTLIAELVGAAVRAGGGALVAVPEIRYGSRVLDSLRSVWPELARVDSGVPDRDRAQAWSDLASGAPVGGGGRSSVLAPMTNLRLLVLDESHHPTYKEDRSPRYDARVVAAHRARLQSAVCVFMASTPSVELGGAALGGRAGWVEPDRHTVRSTRPIVEVVEPPSGRVLSPQLHARVRDALRKGSRVALLASRRGFAGAVWCATCRRSLRCPVCEAGLSFERSARSVRCPRCGHAESPPDTCPNCGASDWKYIGAGSERLEEQLAATWPRARVVRVDPDVLEGSDERPTGLDEANIYLTTWVGTKPALRPEVSFVGVLDADALIRKPDFRAAERAYQALAEMAEWAGPASDGGRLLIQTAEPRSHAVQAVVRADYRFFLTRELEFRKELSYPPFTELVKVTVSGGHGDEAIAKIAAVCRSEGARVLGPIRVGASPGDSRQILAKCPDAMRVATAIRPLVAALPASTRAAIDVDPR